MSADQSIIDLTNETQEEILSDTQDDIEVLSLNLKSTNNNVDDELIICKSTNKKRRLNRVPDVLEISDSPPHQRARLNRRLVSRNGLISSLSDDSDSIPTLNHSLYKPVTTNINEQQNIITTPQQNVPPAPPVVSPGFECPICLEKHKDNLVVTTCGHIFCKACLKESLKTSKQCPKCRKKITTKSFHNIFI